MKDKTIILGVSLGLCLALGVAVGFLAMTKNVGASDPRGEISGGEIIPSVYYDEHWQAIRACFWDNTTDDFTCFDPSPVAVTQAPQISVHTDITGAPPAVITGNPIMKVTRWQVHGHLHFQ